MMHRLYIQSDANAGASACAGVGARISLESSLAAGPRIELVGLFQIAFAFYLPSLDTSRSIWISNRSIS